MKIVPNIRVLIKDLQNIFFSYRHPKRIVAQISDLCISVDGNFKISVSHATSEPFWVFLSSIPLIRSINRLYQLFYQNRSIPFLTISITIILSQGTIILLPKSSNDSQLSYNGLQSPARSAYPSSPFCHQVFRSPSSNQALSCLMKCLRPLHMLFPQLG